MTHRRDRAPGVARGGFITLDAIFTLEEADLLERNGREGSERCTVIIPTHRAVAVHDQRDAVRLEVGSPTKAASLDHGSLLRGRTAWARDLPFPTGDFLSQEPLPRRLQPKRAAAIFEKS